MAPPPEVGSSSTDSGFGPQRVLALLSAGLGVAFATVGVVAYFDAKSERDESRAYCKNDVCSDRRGLDLTTEAVNDGNLATAGTIAGAVGVALGALLWFTAPGPSPEETHVGLGAGRVVVRGSF